MRAGRGVLGLVGCPWLLVVQNSKVAADSSLFIKPEAEQILGGKEPA